MEKKKEHCFLNQDNKCKGKIFFCIYYSDLGISVLSSSQFFIKRCSYSAELLIINNLIAEPGDN